MQDHESPKNSVTDAVTMNATERLRRRYEGVAYKGQAYRSAHPERLWAIARLVGINAPIPKTARVLELGCGDGTNLLAMASTLPGAYVEGVDLSETIMSIAYEEKENIGASNLHLSAASIANYTPRQSTYDYIIAHGVWSWVPPDVQDAIFDIIAKHLAPNGVAYVSYNTRPGWDLRGVVRDAIRWRVRNLDDPEAQLATARTFVATMARNLENQTSSHSVLWCQTDERFREASDGYLYHDYLSPYNDAVHLETFVERARRHELAYMGEARFSDMLTSRSPIDVSAIGATDETLTQEQIVDYLRCRSFRRTLLTHSHITRNINLHPLETISAMWISMHGGPVSNTGNESGEATIYETSDGVQIECEDSLSKIALACIHAIHPGAVTFKELLQRIANVSEYDESADTAANLACLLSDCFAVGLLELHPSAPAVATAVSKTPRGYMLAQQQAKNGCERVTNVYQQTVHLDSLERALLIACTGSLSRDGLLEALAAAAKRGELAVEVSGSPVADLATLKSIFNATLDAALKNLHTAALLCS
jgi:SAM-dependent methyltransferase